MRCSPMTIILKNNGARRLSFDPERLRKSLNHVIEQFPHFALTSTFVDEIVTMISDRETISADQINKIIVLKALDRIGLSNDEEEYHPDWTYVAARFYLKQLYHEAAEMRSYGSEEQYGSFYGLLKRLGTDNIYSPIILRDYSKEEIKQAQDWIDPSKDHLFTYIGLKTLADRYLAKSYDGQVMELPQERFMVIAMVLMSQENREKRMELVKEAYWALSNLYMTVATPTLSNAGKSYGQLSSCFIDTVDDSLRGIYDSNTDVATLSKAGGGIGIYLGKIRAKGSNIRGFKGVSSGVNETSPLAS